MFMQTYNSAVAMQSFRSIGCCRQVGRYTRLGHKSLHYDPIYVHDMPITTAKSA